jgi:hypothetical protein
MRRELSKLFWSCGLLAAISALGCGAEGTDDPNTGGTGAPVPGGSTAAGMGGASGTTSTPVAGNTGTAGTTTPPSAGAGAGGMGGMSMSMGGSGGMMGMTSGSGGMAGTAGSSGSSGMSMGEAQCLMDVMASGTTVTACQMCLCKMDKCQAEMNALKGDTNGAALVKCSQEKKCSGACCLCGAPCDPLGANYAQGMCAAQTETAAGVTPGAGALANGAMVQMNCAANGPMTNSCARATRLGECTAMKCMAECMPPACM